MDITITLAVIIISSLIHASFQLSVSVLSLLSGHTIGAKHTKTKLTKLSTGFVLGVGLMVFSLISTLAWLLIHIYLNGAPDYIWAAASGLLVGLAVAIWLFYYRRGKGTVLWIPRSFSEYLTDRTKVTTHTVEAFGLGLTSVFAELVFIIGPVLIAALAIIQLPFALQVPGVILYTLLSLLPLIIIWMLINEGYSISRIQSWRERNKHFLQFTAGLGLIILTILIYSVEIIGSSTRMV